MEKGEGRVGEMGSLIISTFVLSLEMLWVNNIGHTYEPVIFAL